jgi:peptide/nickel transport system substrate-binding protein
LTRGARTSVALVAVAALALLTAGCTSTAKTGDKVTGGALGRGTAAVAEQIQINPVAYAKVADGGVLHYPLNEPIANFNKYELDGNNINTATIMDPILPSLFTIDGADNFAPDPDYLTGEPTVTTSPAQTMTYDLNPKAKWSDGTPISYRDFVSQWQALNGTDPNYTLQLSASYSDIASVARGATDQQVVVTLKAGVVDADWRGLFSPLYPMSATETPAAFNTGWKAKPLASGGPFMFQGATATTYTLVRNPSWWGRAPKLTSIVFKVLPQLSATVAALTAHQIDVQDIGPDAITYGQVKSIPNISMRTAGGPNYRAITFNGARPDLSNVKVRQALSMGIDRNAIAAAELLPLGIAHPTAPDDHIFQANQVGYQNNAGQLGTYNPTVAGQMLDAAGWTDDPTTHTRTKAGKPLDLSMVVPAGVALSLNEAQIVTAQLAKIDVKVAIKQVPADTLFNKYVDPGNYDLTVFSWLGNSFPISSASSIYEPEQPGHDWQENYSRVSVPQISTLFKQAEADLDQAAANAAANQADALIWENVLSLPIYQRPDVWATNSKLANFGAFGFATVDWTDVGFTS